MKHVLRISCALMFAASSASAQRVKPAPIPAPFSGVYQPRGVDEQGIWREDDEGERQLAHSPIVIRDEALSAYVKGVLCKAVGADRCNAARIYIVREPVFNATMSPNGTMRVFSGLLLRVRSEAELAAVLGHEFGHFEKRHSLMSFKGQRRSTDILSWAAVLASISTDPRAARNFRDLELTVYGNFFRYKRDQEREADLVGLGYLNGSQLQPQAASKIWRNLIAEAQASATDRGMKAPRLDRVAFFASHPPEAERAQYLEALATPEGVNRDEGRERYRAALAKWVPLFLDDQIKLNDFGASEYIIGSLAKEGWTAALWHARGELFRNRGAQRDLAHAAEFYARAAELEPTFAPAQRGLGLSLLKLGRSSEGRAALQRYVDLDPGAADASMIKLTIASTGEN